MDLWQQYNSDDEDNSGSGDLSWLICKIDIGQDPFAFRNDFLGIMQLYFDGIVEQNLLKRIFSSDWPTQKTTLDALCLAGKKTIGGFYRGYGISEKAKEIVLDNKKNIIYNGLHDHARRRHLLYYSREVQQFGKMIEGLQNNFDIIVCNASGGFEPAFLAMDLTGLDMIPVRYSIRAKSDYKLRIPRKAPKDYLHIAGKSVLLVEDIAERGITMSELLTQLSRYSPKELHVAAPFVTAHDIPNVHIYSIWRGMYAPFFGKFTPIY